MELITTTFGLMRPWTNQDAVAFFAIASPEEAIGGIGTTFNSDVHRLSAELGYWLEEQWWGRGIMTEAVVKYSDHIFEQFGLVRIYAESYN